MAGKGCPNAIMRSELVPSRTVAKRGMIAVLHCGHGHPGRVTCIWPFRMGKIPNVESRPAGMTSERMRASAARSRTGLPLGLTLRNALAAADPADARLGILDVPQTACFADRSDHGHRLGNAACSSRSPCENQGKPDAALFFSTTQMLRLENRIAVVCRWIGPRFRVVRAADCRPYAFEFMSSRMPSRRCA